MNVRAKVASMQSIRDPDGKQGMRIEFVEERAMPRPGFVPVGASEEARMAQEIFRSFQQAMPMLQIQATLQAPKLILFLNDEEYEALGLILTVNQLYELELKNGSISFRRVE